MNNKWAEKQNNIKVRWLVKRLHESLYQRPIDMLILKPITIGCKRIYSKFIYDENKCTATIGKLPFIFALEGRSADLKKYDLHMTWKC